MAASPQHLAVCGACRHRHLGKLLPLTPLWMLDQVSTWHDLYFANAQLMNMPSLWSALKLRHASAAEP